jgi:hypothetical protein
MSKMAKVLTVVGFATTLGLVSAIQDVKQMAASRAVLQNLSN